MRKRARIKRQEDRKEVRKEAKEGKKEGRKEGRKERMGVETFILFELFQDVFSVLVLLIIKESNFLFHGKN